jgi:hypothetical protein
MFLSRKRLEIGKFGLYVFLPISVMYIVGRPEIQEYIRRHHTPHIPDEVYETRNLSLKEIHAALQRMEASKGK